MAGVRLEWDGKKTQVDRRVMPLQVVETVNVTREPATPSTRTTLARTTAGGTG